MWTRIIAICFLLATLPTAWADDTGAAKKYEALLKEFEEEGGPRLFAKRFLSFAKSHPDDPQAIESLRWVIQKVRGRPDTDAALQLLRQRHVKSEQIASACADIANSRSAQAEPLLRKLLADSPNKSTRAAAGIYLAALLDAEANIASQLKAQPELAARVLQYYGKPYGKHLAGLNPTKLDKERERVYEQLLKSFPEEKIQDTTIEEIASQRLFYLRNLAVGKVAPEIRGEDIGGKELKLSDHRGKIVMLTFWGHW